MVMAMNELASIDKMDSCPHCGKLKNMMQFFCKECIKEGSESVQITVLFVGGRLEQEMRNFYSHVRTIKSFR